jgi:predicted alpha/beta-hydrolase family hydrolase
MVEFARGLADRGVGVVTFNFLYMEQGRRTPDPKEKLEACYRQVIRAVREDSLAQGRALLVGGKSLGGRMASHLAAENDGGIRGLICLGYPLHPPGKPERERSAHFQNIRVPSLFVQGSRDAFGTPDELRPRLNLLSAPAQLRIVEGGDHSFSVPKNWPVPQRQVYESIKDDIAAWIGNLAERRGT